MNAEEFIEKWLVGYEDLEHKAELSIEMETDLIAYANQSKWIKVGDITPPIDKDLFSVPVLIRYKNGEMDVDKWDFYNGTFNCLASTQVTHWQPLPTFNEK